MKKDSIELSLKAMPLLVQYAFSSSTESNLSPLLSAALTNDDTAPTPITHQHSDCRFCCFSTERKLTVDNVCSSA